MIAGVGTDLVAIDRFTRMWERHGARISARILSSAELAESEAVLEMPRWLAKRWAAKEAFAKAAGTGMRAPLRWSGITIVHDALGRPDLRFAPFIQAWLHRRGIDRCHLSISDERDYACAFVVLEHIDDTHLAA
jgi:holo-[acyl-carrier protein] synthase